MSKTTGIKNRAPNPIQITAEQLLREAFDRGLEEVKAPPKQFVTDKEELQLYQQTKRKDFEDQLRRQRQQIGIWCRYALWEASQLDFERARSVFERALGVDYRNQTLWLKYAEMEMKNKFVNHARNVWDRAVTLHPRVDTFWYKYSYMEEMVEAIENARQVFERWMKWEPDDMAWAAYIKFEVRQSQINSARKIYERYIALLPTARAYLKYAKWEEQNNEKGLARKIYERAMEELHSQEKTEKLVVNFARFEERCKEFERARIIYQFAINQLQSKDIDTAELKQEFLAFEKRHGNKESIEDTLLVQKREQYEKVLSNDALNYDTWFDYIRLEESESDFDTVRSLYERAIISVPPVAEKKYWKRYIYLWINYAIFEELQAKDVERTRSIYRKCLQVIPHKIFTFGKIWLMAAHFEVRQKDLAAARKLLGQAIGMCGKDNIFKGYIELEQQLGEIDRCRTLYAKYIEKLPHNSYAWKAFAQLESSVGEINRARSLFEIAINQVDMDLPELLWKAYIDFEIGEQEADKARALYERLLERSQHLKVWIAFAKFEFELVATAKQSEEESGGSMDNGTVATARDVFSRGYDSLKEQGLKEERLLLLEAWKEVETEALRLDIAGGSRENLADVESKFPKQVKKKRVIEGSSIEEEYFDYVFPDDEKKLTGMKLLEKAMAWKNKSSAVDDSNASVLGKRNHVENNEEIDI